MQVLPYFEPHKVLVDGPGIRNGIPASLETFFRIDTREAGLEQPEVLIKVNKKKNPLSIYKKNVTFLES